MDENNPSQSSQPWSLPPISTADTPSAAEFIRTTFHSSSSQSAQQEEIEKSTGFQKGYEEGLLAAKKEVTQQQSDLIATLDFLRNPIAKIDDQIEHELVELSLAVAKQILNREIKTDPKHIIGLIRTAVEQLPSGDHEINIHLNPVDAEIVDKTLKKYDSDRQWRVVKDPSVSRSDCKIHADPSYIDAGASSIIDQLAVEFLGGDRKNDDDAKSKTAGIE